MVIELTELCAVSTRERVRARVSLGGWLSAEPLHASTLHASTLHASTLHASTLHVDVAEVVLEEAAPREWVSLEDYRRAEVDPLHAGAAEQLQHLAAHHRDAIAILSRLCDREALLGVTSVNPIALDRYGIVLRCERLRGHRDVRLPFRRRIDTGTEAAIEMRHLLHEGARTRPCRER